MKPHFQLAHFKSLSKKQTKIIQGISFLFICFQQLSFLNVTTLRCLKDNRYIRDSKTLFLAYQTLPSFYSFFITVDRDQTVSQRSKPNSGTILMDEQSNPWNRLQLQDIISRHRGLKLLHR